MDVSLLRFALICLMVCVGLIGVFVIVLPIVIMTSMVGGAASGIAASKSSDEDEH